MSENIAVRESKNIKMMTGTAANGERYNPSVKYSAMNIVNTVKSVINVIKNVICRTLLNKLLR